MLKRFAVLALSAVVVATMAFMGGCESDAGNSALIGSAVGAGIGALAGGDTQGALTGAAIGGGVGYVAGSGSDKKKTQQEIAAIRDEQNIETIWITNSNGSKSPVKLRKNGPAYIGPNGEHYTSRPTEEELRQIYGF